MRLFSFLMAVTASAMLCACQSSPSNLTACENKYQDGVIEFSYDECLWRIDKTKGIDFDFWSVKNFDGKIVVNIYLGFTPDVAYGKRDFSPKPIRLKKFLLSESSSEEGYEALLELPKDLYGRSAYVHIFSPALNVEDLGRVKRLVRSVRMEGR